MEDIPLMLILVVALALLFEVLEALFLSPFMGFLVGLCGQSALPIVALMNGADASSEQP